MDKVLIDQISDIGEMNRTEFLFFFTNNHNQLHCEVYKAFHNASSGVFFPDEVFL
jgi:hypothetical protein